MVAEGNLEKLDYSGWTTPIVQVMKPDETARICGDYKVTLNPCLQVQQHPIPQVEECFQAMNGGKKISKIDFSQAYNQVMLNEDSKNLTTINTHLGLYRWNRLPYGIASSQNFTWNDKSSLVSRRHHSEWRNRRAPAKSL